MAATRPKSGFKELEHLEVSDFIPSPRKSGILLIHSITKPKLVIQQGFINIKR
jgi:hypothetical protein